MVEIGVLLPTREAVMYGDGSGDPRPLVDLAVNAEAAGFDSVWAGDSLLARPRAEPLTLLAGVATRTSSVRLGTAVLLPSLRNAEQLAQATATLDALSGGRFILGIGAGPGTPGVAVDHGLVGTDFERRASLSWTVVERVRGLWLGTDGDQVYPLPGSADGPAIWCGGSGPRTLERAGRGADGWFPTATTPERFAAGLARVREVAEAAGRNPADVVGAAYLTVVFGAAAPAEKALHEHSELYYGVPHAIIAEQQGSIAGPEAMVGAWLREFIDAGAEHLCVRVGCEDVRTQLETLSGLLGELRR
ncbi:MAG: LLM class flavin-dependent oxidoreductase [Acidimicrobiia bacterium]|nr:LLM class flavin-dependent oxidoreductase [Acidimicrobiia bacterium]